MILKEASATPGKVRVTFELPNSIWAERVYLVGAFNDWDRTRTPMRQTGPDGSWRVTLELDAGGEYQFRYLIDGETWYNDNSTDTFVANDYGSDNSVVRT
jgi:1,4-alpha-glucan branching enzyme